MENITVILGPIAYDQGDSRVQKGEVSIRRQYITSTYGIKEGTRIVFNLKMKFNKQYFSTLLPAFQIEILRHRKV